MLFVDRVFLSFYSNEAFNASINASTASWALLVFFLSISSIATTVFVSQYHGTGNKKKQGEMTWQMLWLGLFTIPLFIFISAYAPDWIWPPGRLEKNYFRWASFFGFAYVLYGAFSGFFIGQGKTKMVSLLSLATNIVNILFDFLLIFGVEGIIPAYGISGAAVATSLSMVFQTVVLGCIFFNRENRETKGTTHWRFKEKAVFERVEGGGAGSDCREFRDDRMDPFL